MAAITEKVVQCAYEMGVKVYRGEMTHTDAKAEVNRRTGMWRLPSKKTRS